MKKKFLLFVVIVMSALGAFATDYYISSTGNTTNSGTNIAAPWSLAKLNSSINTIQPGDKILFKRDDKFIGSVSVKSGAVNNKVTYGAYGIGAKPVLSGAKPLTGWTLVNGMYEMTSTDKITHLYVNGKQQTIARFPNSGYLTITSSANGSMDNVAINLGFSWVGATAYYRQQNDWIRKGVVTASSGSSVTAPVGNINVKNGFFLDNKLEAIDIDGEWFQNSTTKKIYFKSSTDPNTQLIEGSSIVSCFDSYAPSYITFDNLDIRYYTERGFKFSVPRFIDLKDLDFHYNNWNDFKFEGQQNDRANDMLISGCKMLDCNSTSVEASKVDRFTFTNNEIRRSNMIPGYEYDDLNAGMGMYVIGLGSSLISNNVIDSTGYSCIVWNGTGVIIDRNIVYHNGVTKNDNGFIQSWGGETANNEITNNICSFGSGNLGGLDPLYNKEPAAEGIYFDDFTHDNKIIGNTVSTSNNGIFVQSSRNFEIKDNITYDCSWNGLFLNEKDVTGIWSEQAQNWIRDVNNITVTNNVFFAARASQMAMRTSSDACGQEMDFGTFNNNYYFNLYSKPSIVYSIQPCSGNRKDNLYNLGNWQTRYNQDAASKSNDFIIFGEVAQNTGSNLVSNGNFDANTNDWSGYQSQFGVFWVNNVAGMTGGCVKLVNREAEGDFSSPTFGITAGKKYVVRFRVKATASNIINVLVVKAQPFDYISSNYYIGYDGVATDYQIIFTAPSTVANAKLSLRFFGQDDIWMDDFSVYEAANVTPVDYTEKSKLVINDTQVTKTYNYPPNTYKDLDGMEVTTFTLAPYKSKIIISNNTPFLPVNLISFIGRATENGNVLKWATSKETQNSNFNVLRSTDGVNFKNIGKVAASSVTGNSTEQSNYTFLDSDKPANAYYKLSQTDLDGITSEISTVINVKATISEIQSQVYPNPVTDYLNTVITSSESKNLTFNLVNISGKLVYNKIVRAEAGNSAHTINMTTYDTGIYILQVKDASGKIILKSKVIKK